MDKADLTALQQELIEMEASALSLVPRHESYLSKLRALSREIIADIEVPADDHFGFVAVQFHAKQLDHAQAMLLLAGHPDAQLVARTMLEGLALLKWCHHDPQIRALRWRMFPLVIEWRHSRASNSPENALQAAALADLESRISAHGDLLLSKRALKARRSGRPKPTDPYIRDWYDAQLKDVFDAVKGQFLYSGAYNFASEWIHWSPGGMVTSIAITDDSMRYSSSSPVIRTSALGEAFRSLAETTILVAQHFGLPQTGELELIANEYLDELGRDA